MDTTQTENPTSEPTAADLETAREIMADIETDGYHVTENWR